MFQLSKIFFLRVRKRIMAFNLNILFVSDVTNHAILHLDKLFLSEVTNYIVTYPIISFSLRQVTNHFSADLTSHAVRGDKSCIVLPTEYFIAKISNYTVCASRICFYTREVTNHAVTYPHNIFVSEKTNYTVI